MHRCWGAPVGLLLLAGLAACGSDEPARDDGGAIAEQGDIGVQSVEVGDCFNDSPEMAEQEDAEVGTLGAVPCDEPHDNETYHLFDLPDGDYPGDAQVSTLAFEGCSEPFEGYIGLAYEESELEIFPLTPTESSWDEFDDREVICAVYLPGERLTGSVRDSAR